MMWHARDGALMRMIDEEGRCWKQISKRKYLAENDPNRYRERIKDEA